MVNSTKHLLQRSRHGPVAGEFLHHIDRVTGFHQGVDEAVPERVGVKPGLAFHLRKHAANPLKPAA